MVIKVYWDGEKEQDNFQYNQNIACGALLSVVRALWEVNSKAGAENLFGCYFFLELGAVNNGVDWEIWGVYVFGRSSLSFLEKACVLIEWVSFSMMYFILKKSYWKFLSLYFSLALINIGADEIQKVFYFLHLCNVFNTVLWLHYYDHVFCPL